MVNLWSATVCSQEASHFGYEKNPLGIHKFKAGNHENLVLCRDFHLENALAEELPWCSPTMRGTLLSSLRALTGQGHF